MILILIGGAILGVLAMSNEASASEPSNLKPSPYDDEFKKWSSFYSIDWKLVKTIAMNESSLGANARVKRGIENPYDISGSTSTDGKSWGLMQMTIPTARDFDKNADEIKLNDPEYSIRLGSQFISTLYKQFNGKVRDVVMAYNHGAGNQRRFIELERTGKLKSTEFPAGRQYFDKYVKNYKFLFGGNP